MPSRFDLLYLAAAAAGSPALVVNGRLRGKLAEALRERDGRVPTSGDGRKSVLIHGVSLGEVNAARPLVDALRERRPDLRVIVSSTTRVGIDRARSLYGEDPAGDVLAVRFPLDLGGPVRRFLDATRPAAAVLMELEVWPNLVAECGRRGVPVVVANGRITERSFRGYRRLGPIIRPTFGRLSRVLAQEAVYADRFAELGVPRDRVEVVPPLKFDAATVGDSVSGDAKLAADLGLDRGSPLVVAGSTGPGEEATLLDVYGRLRGEVPGVRLAVVPRKPERFEEVAGLIAARFPVIRRSRGGLGADAVILGDTMGELRKFYALADAVFVGRTLVDLGEKQHGSDMIEPAALGRAVAVGPFTGNFAEPMRAFREAGAIAEVADADELHAVLRNWLSKPAEAKDVGDRARSVVIDNRGGSARTADAVLDMV